MATQERQLARTLSDFYSHPIAKVSLEIFFSVITVILFAVFAIRPTLLTMADLVKEIDDKKTLVDKLNQKIAALSTVQSGGFLPNQGQLDILDEAIPHTPQFERAILVIEKIASKNNLLIQSVTAKEIPKEPVVDVDFSQKSRISRPIQVTVVGDYPSMRQFVEDLLHTRRAMVVDSIIFTLSDQQGKPSLRATITINVEYFAPAVVAQGK